MSISIGTGGAIRRSKHSHTRDRSRNKRNHKLLRSGSPSTIYTSGEVFADGSTIDLVQDSDGSDLLLHLFDRDKGRVTGRGLYLHTARLANRETVLLNVKLTTEDGKSHSAWIRLSVDRLKPEQQPVHWLTEKAQKHS